MEKIIALCVSVVLAIGLIGYAIVTAQRQYSYASDDIGTYNADVNMRLRDSNIIRKDEAIRYIKKRNVVNYDIHYIGKETEVLMKYDDKSAWAKVDLNTVTNDLNMLSSKAMFKIKQIKDKFGKVSKIVLEYIEEY